MSQPQRIELEKSRRKQLLESVGNSILNNINVARHSYGNFFKSKVDRQDTDSHYELIHQLILQTIQQSFPDSALLEKVSLDLKYRDSIPPTHKYVDQISFNIQIEGRKYSILFGRSYKTEHRDEFKVLRAERIYMTAPVKQHTAVTQQQKRQRALVQRPSEWPHELEWPLSDNIIVEQHEDKYVLRQGQVVYKRLYSKLLDIIDILNEYMLHTDDKLIREETPSYPTPIPSGAGSGRDIKEDIRNCIVKTMNQN